MTRSVAPLRAVFLDAGNTLLALDYEVIAACFRGGPRRILGTVTEPHAVRRVLAALGLAAEPPPGRAVPAA